MIQLGYQPRQGVVVVSGTLSAALLTLIILPVTYYWACALRDRFFPPKHGDLVMEALQFETTMLTLEEVDRRHILHVVEMCGGNRTNAAQVLDIDRKTLYRKLLRWGVAEK